MRSQLFGSLGLLFVMSAASAQPGPGLAAGTIPGPMRANESAQIEGGKQYTGTPAAQAAFKAGEQAQQSGASDRALKSYGEAVALDPNYAAAQQKYFLSKYFALYVAANGSKDQEKAVKAARRVVVEYQSLAERHPDNPVYPWILGSFFQNELDVPRENSYCQESVKRDQHFGPGWVCLAHVAKLRRHTAEELADLRKAAHLLPNDQNVAGKYATVLAETSRAHSGDIKTLLRRFPKDPTIAAALVTAADRLGSKEARVAALEELRRDPPASDLSITQDAAQRLYPIYIMDDARKAEALASEMASGHGEPAKMWAVRKEFAEGLVKVQRAIDAGQAASALTTLDRLKRTYGQLDTTDRLAKSRYYLARATALDAAGRTTDAMAELRDRFIASPNDNLLAAMVSYGAKQGQSRSAVYDAVWAELTARAKTAPPFTLRRLDNQRPVALSDYRGKVVVVDFWYPSCGPCLDSFPYLQKVASKFAAQGLSVLAVNSVEEEQPYAEPYLRGMQYTFIGLADKGNETLAMEYGVKGFPSTYFIGPNGKILFNMEIQDEAAVEKAEAALKFMLALVKK